MKREITREELLIKIHEDSSIICWALICKNIKGKEKRRRVFDEFFRSHFCIMDQKHLSLVVEAGPRFVFSKLKAYLNSTKI